MARVQASSRIASSQMNRRKQAKLRIRCSCQKFKSRCFDKIKEAEISPLLFLSCPEKNLKEAKKHHVNVVVAGHMASDSLGMNLFLDELERECVKITLCSGLLRHSRL